MEKIKTIFLIHANAVFLAIVLAHYSLYHYVPVVPALSLAIVLAIGSCFFLEKRWQIVICLLIWALSGWHGVRDATFHLDVSRAFSGTVLVKTVPEKTKTSSWRFTGEDVATGRDYSVTLRKFANPKLGDLIQGVGAVDPGSPPRNPGGSDSGDYLKREKLSGFLSLREGNRVGNEAPFFGVFVSTLRGALIVNTQAVLPEKYANLLIGLILGDKGISLDETWESWYRNLGLIHILVVSGSQVSLLGGICFLMLRPFRLKGVTLYSVMTVINVVFYALTGGGASIFRAILMTQIILYLKLIRQNTDALDILCTTALVMVLWDPSLAFNLGAQLSFLATASLIFGVPLMAERLTFLPASLREVTALGVVPFLFTAPLIWHHFQVVSLLSPLANMLVLPLIEVLVPIGFFCMGFNALLPSLMSWPMQGCLGLMQGLNALVSGLVSLNVKPVLLPKLDFFHMCALYLGGYVSFFGDRQRRQYGAVLLGVVCLSIGFVTWWPSPYYTVTYLDVGQGDATLIKTPYGKSYLIDAGNRVVDYRTGKVLWDVGQRVVLPAMQYYGLRGLDAFILTHFDMDHIGGARSVVKGTHVRQLLTHHAPDLTKAGIDDAIDVLRLSYPAKLVLDKHAYLLFYPFLFQRETPRENERSVICQLVIGDHRFLFTGDLESDGEAYLAATYGERLQSDIFKAGHHGSKTSSTAALLRYVQPEIAVVSVGERNRYGHPNKDVLARFESSGVRIYRTDRDGAIEIKTDGKGLWVKTYVP
jgi:competence protein ComEC